MRPTRSIAKITHPSLRRVAARPRLFGWLDRLVRRHSIVWVSAPAGSGKTTLAASWLAERQRPCLWYQMDAGDADPATFFYFLRESVRRLAPRRRESLPFLTSEYALGLSVYARNFFEGAGARIPPGTVLVLDNYQDLAGEAPLHSLLPSALSALPEDARVLVLSRSAPPSPFARLITEGIVGFLAADELTLTHTETRALARARIRQPLTAATSADLLARSGGWMAATVLLLEASTRPLPVRRGAETEEQQVLFDYFAAEVFEKAAPRTQRFLLATALLPEASVTAAEALASEPRAAEILADLVTRNYFTLRLAGQEPRYRYHPLFREFLLSRARRSIDGAAWRALAKHAAEILNAAGSVNDAATILAGAGHHDALAMLIRIHASAFAHQGRLASVENWIRALPEAMVEFDPWLAYWLGTCRMADMPRARTHFETAYRAFRGRGELEGALLAWAGVATTFLYPLDDLGELDPWVADMEEFCRSNPVFPSIDVEAQVTFGMYAALTWRDPAHPAIRAWENRAMALLDSEAAPELRMQLANHLVFYHSALGDNATARHVIGRVRPLLAAPDVTPRTELLWCFLNAMHGTHTGDTAACHAAVERGLETAGRTGILWLNHFLAMHGAAGALAAGDLVTARRYHARAGEFLGPGENLNIALFHTLGAWIELCAGDVPRAEELARTSLERLLDTGSGLMRPLGEYTLAHVLIERDKQDEAARLIEGVLADSRRIGNLALEHDCLLSLGYASMRRGREAEALAWLRAGLQLGRERGFITHAYLGWRRDVMARLAAMALEHGVEVEHVLGLIRAKGLVEPKDAASLEIWPRSIQIRTLGAFELRRDGTPVEFGARSRKPLALLQLLAASGGEVRVGTLVDALWPDAEGDRGHHALETTLYRLRKILGFNAAVAEYEGAVALDAVTCWTDLQAMRKGMARVAALCERGTANGATLLRETERLVALYRGPFLPKVEAAWAEMARERLRSAITRHLAAAGRALERDGHGAAAQRMIQQALAADADLGASLPVLH